MVNSTNDEISNVATADGGVVKTNASFRHKVAQAQRVRHAKRDDGLIELAAFEHPFFLQIIGKSLPSDR